MAGRACWSRAVLQSGSCSGGVACGSGIISLLLLAALLGGKCTGAARAGVEGEAGDASGSSFQPGRLQTSSSSCVLSTSCAPPLQHGPDSCAVHGMLHLAGMTLLFHRMTCLALRLKSGKQSVSAIWSVLLESKRHPSLLLNWPVCTNAARVPGPCIQQRTTLVVLP